MKETTLAIKALLVAATCFTGLLTALAAQPAAADVDLCGSGPRGHLSGCAGSDGAKGCVSGPRGRLSGCAGTDGEVNGCVSGRRGHLSGCAGTDVDEGGNEDD